MAPLYALRSRIIAMSCPLLYPTTHLLPGPQSVVLLVFALPVRHAVLAHNPAAGCQCRALCVISGASKRQALRSPQPNMPSIALSKTYPAILKSVDVCLRGLRGQLVVSWYGRFLYVARSNDPSAEESRMPRPLTRLGTATFRIFRLERGTARRLRPPMDKYHPRILSC